MHLNKALTHAALLPVLSAEISIAWESITRNRFGVCLVDRFLYAGICWPMTDPVPMGGGLNQIMDSSIGVSYAYLSLIDPPTFMSAARMKV